MKNLLREISKLRHIKINSDIERYVESDIFWATKRHLPFINRIIRTGEIYQFEFGKNFIPEMSYEHRGLVIGISKRLLYVLPIYSFNPENKEHRKAYKYNTNDKGKFKLYFLDKKSYPFLEHDSVLKLDDLRTVSVKRIKYKHKGYINNTSDTYNEITRMVFGNCFPTYSYEYDRLSADNENLKKKVQVLEEEIKSLTN